MKNKRILYMIMCTLGSAMTGFFARKLDRCYGSILFTVGVVLIVG